MRSVVLWLLLVVTVAAANYEEQPFEGIEEEDVGTDVEVDEEDPYGPNEEDVNYRRKREIYEPYDEHNRVKRCCEDRVRRSAEYVRTPRQVHQYEVHEFTDENDPSSPPYEEMLAASADHYHRVYAAPGAPKTARYNQDTSKGFHQNHYLDKGGKGHKTDEHHKKEYEEALGKKKKHHDQAGHKGSHEEEAHGHRGAKFDEKKGHKKGHKTKGYHNKYHKDEFHKEHKFYDDYHKSGEHHRYGKFNAKHASNESGKKKAHKVNAGHDFVERGKKGYSNKGHVDADHKGHDGKHGHEDHHHSQSSHGKKGGKEGASHWGYAKKN